MNLQKIITFNNFIFCEKTPCFSAEMRALPFEAEKKKPWALARGVFIIVLFLALHLALFNINVAEWGDSYRILRAAEFVRDGSYPQDEKRPPLFSIILSLYPQNFDQVFFGRVIVLLFSIGSLYIFNKIIKNIFESKFSQKLALLLLILNPVYLYWSIRIMADVPFSFVVLLAFYILSIQKKEPKLLVTALLGLISSIAALIRFEGFLLFGALLFGIVFYEGFKDFKQLLNISYLFKKTFKEFNKILIFILSFVVGMLPFWLYRNPFDSKYFSEPASRAYDIKMVSIYLLSLLFVMGTVFALNFILLGKEKTLNYLFKNPGVFIFVVLEMILILLWPAAVPRLFVPIIPFFVIFMVFGLENLFSLKINLKTLFPFFISFFVYVIGQYIFRLQFLGVMKLFFILIVVSQLLVLLSIYLKKRNYFYLMFFISLSIWSFSTIYTHKSIFISVKNAGEYAVKNLTGLAIYNDVSSVSDWYLNQKNKSDKISGYYYNTESKERMSFENLKALNPDYLIITNEHNTSMDLDIDARPYLKEIKEFRYNVNGDVFFTKIISFDKDYIK